ncbi:unnamed protein product [Musa banksii]
MVTRLANTMWSSLKGRPVQGRIFQGREPPHFIALVQPMVVLNISIDYMVFPSVYRKKHKILTRFANVILVLPKA